LWQQTIRNALRPNNKLGFIEGTLKRLELKEGDDSTKYNAWEMVNSMICSWTINVTDPKPWQYSICGNDCDDVGEYA